MPIVCLNFPPTVTKRTNMLGLALVLTLIFCMNGQVQLLIIAQLGGKISSIPYIFLILQQVGNQRVDGKSLLALHFIFHTGPQVTVKLV